ncbi:MAG TPA: hypothetical protein ENH46_05560 [Candidatus Pacearchaeota archaeon]|nr:hypothetical protein [Candidatus Pacearchaeota archaeon]
MRRKGDWKCKFCNRMNISEEDKCHNCDMDKHGCGKRIEILWNYGSKIKVRCGWQEEGFMPDYCNECKQKSA